MARLLSALIPDRRTGIRARIWKMAGIKCGSNVGFYPGVVIFSPKNLSIGSQAFLNSQVFIDATSSIVIGERVMIGPRCTLVTATHSVETRLNQSASISIGNDVWIGANVSILPGSFIPANSVIAAGALVKGTLTEAGLYAGVPAELKRRF